MVVITNDRVPLYSRLWCVWEVYGARVEGIPLSFCRRGELLGEDTDLRKATCSSEDDTRRITNAIHDLPLRSDVEIALGAGYHVGMIGGSISLGFAGQAAVGTSLAAAGVASGGIVVAGWAAYLAITMATAATCAYAKKKITDGVSSSDGFDRLQASVLGGTDGWEEMGVEDSFAAARAGDAKLLSKTIATLTDDKDERLHLLPIAALQSDSVECFEFALLHCCCKSFSV